MAVFPAIKSISTYYIDSASVEDHIANFESCPPEAKNPDAPRSSRLGYEVVEISTEIANRQGTEKDDRWVAPALNCFALADTNTGVFGGRNESEVINIFEGEPPHSWFVLPKGCTERSPSQIAAAWAARFPGHKFIPDWSAAMADRSYVLHRIPRH